jgi:hypothetical protein
MDVALCGKLHLVELGTTGSRKKEQGPRGEPVYLSKGQQGEPRMK